MPPPRPARRDPSPARSDQDPQHAAERLDSVSALDVREAEEGMPLLPGTCVIAPGEPHLVVERTAGQFRA
ncbi:MAG: chemotaxis protein CheB [Planctomycetia bacterium]